MAEQRWRVRLGAAAELDFANILKWTTENFGARQSRVYRNTLVLAIRELADGPDIAGSKARDEIMPGLRTLHVARHGRRGSHFLMEGALDVRGPQTGRRSTHRRDGRTVVRRPAQSRDAGVMNRDGEAHSGKPGVPRGAADSAYPDAQTFTSVAEKSSPLNSRGAPIVAASA